MMTVPVPRPRPRPRPPPGRPSPRLRPARSRNSARPRRPAGTWSHRSLAGPMPGISLAWVTVAAPPVTVLAIVIPRLSDGWRGACQDSAAICHCSRKAAPASPPGPPGGPGTLTVTPGPALEVRRRIGIIAPAADPGARRLSHGHYVTATSSNRACHSVDAGPAVAGIILCNVCIILWCIDHIVHIVRGCTEPEGLGGPRHCTGNRTRDPQSRRRLRATVG